MTEAIIIIGFALVMFWNSIKDEYEDDGGGYCNENEEKKDKNDTLLL